MIPMYEEEKTSKMKQSRFNLKVLISTLTATIITAVLCIGSTRLYNREPNSLSLLRELYDDKSNICPVTEKMIPSKSEQFSELDYFRTSKYKNHSVEVWGNAVRIPSMTYDDYPQNGDDHNFDIFYNMESFIKKSFPHIISKSELIHINTHALIFIIHGENKELKPILLTAHQDVVPVPPETVSRWKYPPFEGHFDGQYLWGRGAADDKDHSISMMEAVDHLLSQGFAPKRTIIIGLGFDEEIEGTRGAKLINAYLLKRYGKDSIFFISDEGGMGVQDMYGARLALPSTGEKGYIDITIELATTGGHASIPPRHTAIGIMSELATLIESKPYELRLTTKNPFYVQLQCMATKGNDMDPLLRNSIREMDYSPAAKQMVLDALDKDIMTRYLVSTSQAIDIFDAGIKINALPEKVIMKINHRVGYDSSLEEVKRTVLENAKIIAKKYELAINDYDSIKSSGFSDIPIGEFTLSTDVNLVPAPKSPASGDSWNIFAGSLKYIYEDFAIYPNADPSIGKEVTVAPSVMSANTDTKYFWNLTDNIYRFSPFRGQCSKNWHAIDERVDLDSHIESVAFFYTLLRNVDEYDSNF